MFATATLTALLTGGDSEPVPGTQSFQLTEHVLPQLTAKIRAHSQHPFHPPPCEGCDAQVTGGVEQGVALPALPAIRVMGVRAASGPGISCCLYSCTARKNSLLIALVVPGWHFISQREAPV